MKMLMFTVFLGLSFAILNDVTAKTTFKDCGGSQKKVSIMSGMVSPDPIVYPGNVSMSVDMEVLRDLPASGLKLNLNLVKLDPYKMPVPCLKNIGSCSYDVCEMIQNHKDQFCPMFPHGVECKCPLTKSRYSLKNAIVPIPDFGEIFAKILKGRYNGTITVEDSNTNTHIACIAVTFEINT